MSLFRFQPAFVYRSHVGATAYRFCARCLIALWLGALPCAEVTTAPRVVPEPLPDPRINGFGFPESEATRTRWNTERPRGDGVAVAPAAFEKIHLHGWGLWTALTAETGQRY